MTKKNLIALCLVPFLVLLGGFFSYGIYLLFSDLLTELMKSIKIYTAHHMFYGIANFALILSIVFIFILLANIKLYKTIAFNKWIFISSTALYIYISINFLLVFIYYSFSYPIPKWLIH